MDKELTVEELQNQLLEIQKENEKLKTEKEATDKELIDTKSSLESSRKIAAELWSKQKGGTSPILNPDDTEDKEELTPEKALDLLLDDALKPNLIRMKKIYGDSINDVIVKD